MEIIKNEKNFSIRKNYNTTWQGKRIYLLDLSSSLTFTNDLHSEGFVFIEAVAWSWPKLWRNLCVVWLQRLTLRVVVGIFLFRFILFIKSTVIDKVESFLVKKMNTSSHWCRFNNVMLLSFKLYPKGLHVALGFKILLLFNIALYVFLILETYDKYNLEY